MRRGEEAERLWNNELLRHALQSLEDDAIRSLKSVRHDDEHGRDAAWRELRAIERFCRKMENYILTGQAAKKTLREKIKEHL